MHERAPAKQRPARVGSQYLLSGLLRCGVCGKPYSGQAAKSGKFAYYVCSSLLREGAGSCTVSYLNAERVEDYIIEKVKERILTEATITELVAAKEEAEDQLERRRADLPMSREIKGVRGGLPGVPDGGDVPGAEGADPQLREGHRDRGRRVDADLYYPHAAGWCDAGIGLGSRFCPVRSTFP